MRQEIEFLQELVKIPSESTKEQAAVDFLVGYSRKLNFDKVCQDGAGNFVAEKGSTGPLVLLAGHVDTVPGVIPVRMEGPNLYGRGAVDAKGSLASFIWAASQAHCRAVVVGCVEEEIYTSKGANFILNKYQPDYIIVGEPSGYNRITIGYKGGIRFTYNDEEEVAHYSAKASLADRAIDFVTTVRNFIGDGQGFDQPHFELRSFNTFSDGLKERVEVKCNVRMPLGFDLESFVELLKKYPVEIYENIPAVMSSKNNNLARSFINSIRANGRDPSFVKKTGSSDMNIFATHWPKVSMVAYGPGDSKLDHTPQEHLDTEEYLKSIEIVKNVLEALR